MHRRQASKYLLKWIQRAFETCWGAFCSETDARVGRLSLLCKRWHVADTVSNLALAAQNQFELPWSTLHGTLDEHLIPELESKALGALYQTLHGTVVKPQQTGNNRMGNSGDEPDARTGGGKGKGAGEDTKSGGKGGARYPVKCELPADLREAISSAKCSDGRALCWGGGKPHGVFVGPQMHPES